MSTPKVSIVIPCYNVEKYLRECLDSVVNQTLRDIQIICINDGSTDSTLAILEEYARSDARIQIINKKNSGYGDSMNRGFDLARGEYIGIVESDDFAERNMFETLYNAAAANHLDVCKAGFYQYVTTPTVCDSPARSIIKTVGTGVFHPVADLQKPGKMTALFTATPAIWAAIYRREFIQANNIRFNTTPGASFQDVGFFLKVWIKAKRVQFLDCCLLHYRTDNNQSSVHNPGKVYCICDEYAEVGRFMENNLSEAAVIPVVIRAKYEHYLWNYERLAEPLQEAFVHRFYEEFKQHEADGVLRREHFSWYDWNQLQKLLIDPRRYHEIQSRKIQGEPVPDFYDIYPAQRPIKSKVLYAFAEKTAVAVQYFKEAGMNALLDQGIHKIKRHVKVLNKKESD